MGYKSFQIYKIKKDIIGSLFIFYWSKLKLKIVKKNISKTLLHWLAKDKFKIYRKRKISSHKHLQTKKALFFSEGEALTLMPENGIIQ